VIGVLAALGLAIGGLAPDPSGAFDARMAASASAAQALQGPLDGRWTLRGARGRPLFILEISDPPQAAGPLAAAWRAAVGNDMGPVSRIDRSSAALRMTIEGSGVPPARVRLRPAGRYWRGRLIRDGHSVEVTLNRG
jgi:hypothetical protein